MHKSDKIEHFPGGLVNENLRKNFATKRTAYIFSPKENVPKGICHHLQSTLSDQSFTAPSLFRMSFY